MVLIFLVLAGLETSNGARIMIKKGVAENELFIAPKKMEKSNHNLNISLDEKKTLSQAKAKEDDKANAAKVMSLRSSPVGKKERFLHSSPSPGDGH